MSILTNLLYTRACLCLFLSLIFLAEPNRQLFVEANGPDALLPILKKLKTDSQIEIILTLVSNVIADCTWNFSLIFSRRLYYFFALFF